MNKYTCLVKRHTKLFFNDKGMFFTSLITPLILLFLYISFLGRVFKSSFLSHFPEGMEIPKKIANAVAGGQLFASLIAVSCVTVAFCCNMLMVQDKMSGARKDFLSSPLRKSTLALSYYTSTFLTTFLISIIASIVCFIYIAIIGWYMSFLDCLLIFIDILLLVMFGTALSSIINYFLRSQGQVTAVGTIVSTSYGFISGAYMPIASLGTGFQNFLMLLPSTYASVLVKRHTMRGVVQAIENTTGVSKEVMNEIKTSMDYNITFFGKYVSEGAMYGIVIGTILLLIGIYILINIVDNKRKKRLKTKKIS